MGRQRLWQPRRDRDGLSGIELVPGEGATINGFRLFYLFQNPNPVQAMVTIEYLLGRGWPPVTLTYRLAPMNRACQGYVIVR